MLEKLRWLTATCILLVCSNATQGAENTNLHALYEEPVDRIIKHLNSIHEPRNIVFCIDVSGSMLGPVAGTPTQRRYTATAEAYSKIIRSSMRPGDIVTVIHFGQDIEILLKNRQLGDDAEFLIPYAPTQQSIFSPDEQQGTNIYYAQHYAAQQALTKPDDTAAVVIMFTDGYLDPPPVGNELRRLYEHYLPNAPGDVQRLDDLGKLTYFDYVGDETGLQPPPPGQPKRSTRGRIVGSILFTDANEPYINVLVEVQLDQPTTEAQIDEFDHNVFLNIDSVITDDTGHFEVGALPAGNYTVRISADGYKSQAISDVIVNGGTTTNLDFALSRSLTWQVVLLIGALILFFMPWVYKRDERRYLTVGIIPIPHQDKWAVRILVVPWFWDRRRAIETSERSSEFYKRPPV